jgi:hypothetical protein
VSLHNYEFTLPYAYTTYFQKIFHQYLSSEFETILQSWFCLMKKVLLITILYGSTVYLHFEVMRFGNVYGMELNLCLSHYLLLKAKKLSNYSIIQTILFPPSSCGNLGILYCSVLLYFLLHILLLHRCSHHHVYSKIHPAMLFIVLIVSFQIPSQ